MRRMIFACRISISSHAAAAAAPHIAFRAVGFELIRRRHAHAPSATPPYAALRTHQRQHAPCFRRRRCYFAEHVGTGSSHRLPLRLRSATRQISLPSFFIIPPPCRALPSAVAAARHCADFARADSCQALSDRQTAAPGVLIRSYFRDMPPLSHPSSNIFAAADAASYHAVIAAALPAHAFTTPVRSYASGADEYFARQISRAGRAFPDGRILFAAEPCYLSPDAAICHFDSAESE